jgi:hypothetical protein
MCVFPFFLCAGKRGNEEESTRNDLGPDVRRSRPGDGTGDASGDGYRRVVCVPKHGCLHSARGEHFQRNARAKSSLCCQRKCLVSFLLPSLKIFRLCVNVPTLIDLFVLPCCARRVALMDMQLVESLMTNLPSDLLSGRGRREPARSFSDQQSSNSNSSSLASFPLSFSSDSFIDDFVEPVN